MKNQFKFTVLIFVLSGLSSVKSLASEKFELVAFVDSSSLNSKPELIYGRDPFRKELGRVREAPTQDSYRLDAIVYSPDKPAAVVNGQIVERGSKLRDGQVVQEIGPDYVLLEFKGRIREVHIGQETSGSQKK